jgi:putative transposase
MLSTLRLYPSDLSDREWEILAPLIPSAKSGGRPRKWPMRKILNAVFYLLRSGCQWRMLPREFPPWSTVHPLLQTMASRRHLGEDQRGVARKATRALRVRTSRNPQPSAGILDTQSVEDHLRWWSSGLRWGEEAQRQKAAFAGRYAGYGAQSQGALGGPTRSCSGASGAGGNGRRVPPP